jgi:predicted ATPase
LERVSRAGELEVGAGTVTPLLGVVRPNNLPVQLTSFVGRGRELRELREALAATRLLTLTGPGGCGKTRLALEAASEVLDRFPGGVWWVELAPLAEGRLVGAAIAQAVGVRPLPGMTDLQAASVYLASRRALLVLDNCEHVQGACAEAAETLLKAAAGVVVLATSRAPLGVGGETDWRVPPLSLPAPDGPTEALAGSDAVSLFLERARKVRPEFAPTGANQESVVRVCRELDGLPLAIELAAARVRMISVEQIAAGVSDRFRLLTGGPHTASERHQTLRASVDWSHDLLSTEGRLLLRRVAVFSGGFTLHAVEQVCTGDGIDRKRVLDLLGSLVDQSLVLAEYREQGVRYRLLETVRQYALERLSEAGEREILRRRHRDFFLELTERAAPHLDTGRQAEWLELLDPEAANVAAAIESALESEPSLALRLCVALYRWWCARGRFAEAELAYTRSLGACGDREPGLRARTLAGRAWVGVLGGDFEAAEMHSTEALALADEVGDRATAGRARSRLGWARWTTNPRAARAEARRAAELAHAEGDDWGFVEAKQLSATAYVLQSDHRDAARANDEIAALADEIGDPYQVARRWFLVGLMACIDGRFAEAREASERIRAAVERVEEPVLAAHSSIGFAFVKAWQGEAEHALDRLHADLQRALTLGAGLVVPWMVAIIALAELAAGRPEQARGRLEGLVALIEGRDAYITSWALGLLADAQRLLGDDAAEPTALRAQATGERIDNRLLATRARLTQGRLAAARGDWAAARRHVLAHLDACVEGGHATLVPACLDALAEVAAGLGRDIDAVRLFAAAGRARAAIGVVRIPPEKEHWAAIDGGLRETLAHDAYETARAEGAELTTDDALEWARRARGPRRRAAGGWGSLTPTETKVAELSPRGSPTPRSPSGCSSRRPPSRPTWRISSGSSTYTAVLS